VTAEEKYVAAAYLVVFLFVLVYILIVASKLARLERDVAELAERVRAKREAERREQVPVG
jgi:CcmD family protein